MDQLIIAAIALASTATVIAAKARELTLAKARAKK